MMFMPTDATCREDVRRVCDAEATALGLQALGWRTVPVDPTVLGPMAWATAPVAMQANIIVFAVSADEVRIPVQRNLFTHEAVRLL